MKVLNQCQEVEISQIESDLEQLSLQLIEIMEHYKQTGQVSEEEYEKNIKVKREFLSFLEAKRNQK